MWVYHDNICKKQRGMGVKLSWIYQSFIITDIPNWCIRQWFHHQNVEPTDLPKFYVVNVLHYTVSGHSYTFTHKPDFSYAQ